PGGTAAKVARTTEPSSTAQSGAAFAPQPVVQVQDANGNPVNQRGVSVTATLASGPSGAVLQGTASVATDAAGSAAFTNLAIAGPAGSYTLAFSAPGAPGVTGV